VTVWGVLAVLALGIAALEVHDRWTAAAPATGDHDDRRLLPVPVAELGAIEIAQAGRLHRFERDASGAWFYHGVHAATAVAHAHVPDPALTQRIERAFAAFGRTRVERQFPVGADAATYGLAAPAVVILVYGPKDSQPLAQYAVGGVAPDTVSRYATLVGSRVVITIPDYHVENLLALVQTAGESAGPTAAR
jgi:hypothetical protein